MEISNFDNSDWREHAGRVCEKGIRAKFEQNQPLLHLLLATGSKTLVECAYDKLRGCGIPLRDDHYLDSAKGVGDNLLGNILMSVRSANNNITGHNTDNCVEQ